MSILIAVVITIILLVVASMAVLVAMVRLGEAMPDNANHANDGRGKGRDIR